MAKLVLRRRGGLSVAFDLSPGARLGRDETCEITVADAKASRHHASFELAPDGAWRLLDQGSRHGSFVNGERVESAALADGDQIQIGATVLELALDDSISGLVSTPMGRPLGDGERLSLFYSLADAARSFEDLDTLLSTTLRGVVDAVSADRGLIALAQDPSAPPRRVSVIDGDDIVVSRSMLEAVMSRGESVMMREHSARPVANTLQAQGVRAALAAPLRSGELSVGFIYVDTIKQDNSFSEQDLELLTAISTMVAAIVDAANQYRRNAALAEVAARALPEPTIIGRSQAILDVRRDIERLGASDISIHVTGESGVGKELVARALHAQSARRTAPLVAMNCAALPDNLIESELFGYVKGAFTGAATPRRGKFALADGGTLFLDEVADLSSAAQAKILRVLEDGDVYPIGSEQPTRVDVRVVSASHKDLREQVEAGAFREDLLYRLVVAEVCVPPLRDRGDDVLLLAEAFLERVRGQGTRAETFSPAALSALRSHSWPGNVRELRNVVERAAALARHREIEVEDLRLEPGRAQAATGADLAARFASLDVTERELVEQALAEANGNVSAAARILGVSRVMMKRRIERFKL